MKKHPLRSHARHIHIARIASLSVLLLALLLARGGLAHSPFSRDSNGQVLAYSTSLDRGALLAATNSYRSQNGMAPLNLNSQLNSAAQMKAQDMVNNNYWAHTSPSGVEPWYWFSAAGYSYQNAGENLAYGFDTSNAVVNGWINSASHRENILGNYIDVGFGFVNGSSYQGGEFTVVVAHYATPYGYTPPTPPAPDPPAPTPPPASAPASKPSSVKPTTPAPASTAEPAPVAAQQTPVETEPTAKAPNDKTPPVATPSEKTVTYADTVTSGQSSPLGILVGSLASIGLFGFGLTHFALFRHTLRIGEQFVMHHPIIDTIAAATVVGLILATKVGMVG